MPETGNVRMPEESGVHLPDSGQKHGVRVRKIAS